MESIGNKSKSYKLKAIIIFDALIIIFLIIYFGFYRSPQTIKINGTYLETPLNIRKFDLTDNREKMFSKQNLIGHWSIIFFGFTQCKMICPMTMAALNKTYRELQQELPNHLLPKIIFISVDPENDTLEKLNEYVNSFNPLFMAARSKMEQIMALQSQLHLPVSQDPADHGTEIVLINPKAEVQAYFAYPHQAERLVRDYKAIIRHVTQKNSALKF